MCHDHDIVCAPGWGASPEAHSNYDRSGNEMLDMGKEIARAAIASVLPPR